MIAGLPPVVVAWLIYPGLLWLVLLVLGVGRIAGGPASGGHALRSMVAAFAGRAPAARAGAVVCVLLALVSLPWPALPGGQAWEAHPWTTWALIEAAALLALLPGLAGTPAASRAAVRELQLGISARLPLWLVMSALTPARPDHAPDTAVVLLALITGLLALPVAGGWAFFAGDSINRDALLSEGEAAVIHLYWRVQTIFLLALVATVLVPLPRVTDWIELLLRVGVIVVGAILVRAGRGTLVVVPLPVAIRWCWWLALPCAVAVLILR